MRYKTLEEVTGKYGLTVDLDEKAQLAEWESRLRNLLDAKQMELPNARNPSLRHKLERECAEIQEAFKFVSQQNFFAKLQRCVDEDKEEIFEHELSKPESRSMLPSENDPEYEQYLELKVAARKKWSSDPLSATAKAISPPARTVQTSDGEKEQTAAARPAAVSMPPPGLAGVESRRSAIEPETIATAGTTRLTSDSELTNKSPAAPGESALPSVTLATAAAGSAKKVVEQTATTISQTADTLSGASAQVSDEQLTETTTSLPDMTKRRPRLPIKREHVSAALDVLVKIRALTGLGGSFAALRVVATALAVFLIALAGLITQLTRERSRHIERVDAAQTPPAREESQVISASSPSAEPPKPPVKQSSEPFDETGGKSSKSQIPNPKEAPTTKVQTDSSSQPSLAVANESGQVSEGEKTTAVRGDSAGSSKVEALHESAEGSSKSQAPTSYVESTTDVRNPKEAPITKLQMASSPQPSPPLEEREKSAAFDGPNGGSPPVGAARDASEIVQRQNSEGASQPSESAKQAAEPVKQAPESIGQPTQLAKQSSEGVESQKLAAETAKLSIETQNQGSEPGKQSTESPKPSSDIPKPSVEPPKQGSGVPLSPAEIVKQVSELAKQVTEVPKAPVESSTPSPIVKPKDSVFREPLPMTKTTTTPRPKIQLALLRIESTPPDATISIRGTKQPLKTPAEFNLMPGDYDIAMALDCYTPVSTTLHLDGGENRVLTRQLQSLQPVLKVRTLPPGAKIYVDGAPHNQLSPATITGIDPGDRWVTVELAGYRSQNMAVKVKCGETVPVDFGILQRPTARVSVTSNARGASVWIDGSESGQSTPCSIELPLGAHRIRLVGPQGYRPEEKSFYLEGEENVRLDVPLTPELVAIPANNPTRYDPPVEYTPRASPNLLVWCGLDYSMVKMIGTSRDFPESEIFPNPAEHRGERAQPMTSEWNELFMKEMYPRLTRELGAIVEADLRAVESRNARVTSQQIVYEEGGLRNIGNMADLGAFFDPTRFLHRGNRNLPTHINDADIAAAVRSYRLQTRSGLGLVFIMDRLVKKQETSCMYVVFFDIASRTIVSQERVCTDAGGGGIRNHWFGSIKETVKRLPDMYHDARLRR